MTGWRRFGPPRTLPAREGYALWAECYPPWAHNPLMRVEQAVIEPIIASALAARALDVGTGSGRNLPLLAATGARFVAGVDFSLPMLTRHRHGRPCVCGDACRLPFRGASFDVVSSSLMAGDIADIGQCIAEFARVLTPGGQLVYSDFHPLWAKRGWRRTFAAADGRRFELRYCSHAIAEHVAELERRAFDIRAIHEPTLTTAEPAAAAGHADTPVLAIFHAVKRP